MTTDRVRVWDGFVRLFHWSLVALIAGVVIGLFQALTSVQEMTLTFVPKVGLMLVVFWVSMSFMTTALADFYLAEIIPMIAGS